MKSGFSVASLLLLLPAEPCTQKKCFGNFAALNVLLPLLAVGVVRLINPF